MLRAGVVARHWVIGSSIALSIKRAATQQRRNGLACLACRSTGAATDLWYARATQDFLSSLQLAACFHLPRGLGKLYLHCLHGQHPTSRGLLSPSVSEIRDSGMVIDWYVCYDRGTSTLFPIPL